MRAVPFWFGAWAACVLLAACGSDYPIPPTACDDYCRATQRGSCDDDDPARCVRDCERNRAAATPHCDAEEQARNECFLSLPADAFSCTNDRSQLPDECLPERAQLSECLVPGSGACVDQCARQIAVCDTSLLDCEARCVAAPTQCLRVNERYHRCLLDYPVECPDFFREETRSPDEIPCFDEALAVLACDPIE